MTAAGPPTAGPSRRGTVLIVEDDVITRVAAVEMVEEAGLTALQAGEAVAAMDLLETHAEVGVVLTDIDMPGTLDGIRLAACIHRRWPGIGLILTSGKVAPRPGDVPFHGLYFPKPYNAAAVLRAIGRLLDESGRG